MNEHVTRMLMVLSAAFLVSGCASSLPDDGTADRTESNVKQQANSKGDSKQASDSKQADDTSQDEGSSQDKASSQDDGSTSSRCLPAEKATGQVCTQVITTCTHDSSGLSCEYATPCAVPDEYKQDADWTCNLPSSEPTKPTCPAAEKPDKGQACRMVVVTCTHEPSGGSCEYGMPCVVPDSLRNSNDWTCTP